MAEMTLDVWKWEAKHTKAVLVCVLVIAAVIFFHKEERGYLAAGLGVAPAILGFT
jgi:hypothetical protein